MSDFPATGQWTIYSIQKTLPYLGKFGSFAGAHNYLALVSPDGAITEEMEGVYTREFSFGTEPGGANAAGNYPQGSPHFFTLDIARFERICYRM